MYDGGTIITDSLALPAFPGTGAAVLVLTRDTTAGSVSSAHDFDRIEFFRRDSVAAAWVPVFTDPVDGGHAVELRDVTGDGMRDVLVHTRLPDADTVAGRGLAIYAPTPAGGVALVFTASDGAPVPVEHPGVTGCVIRVAGSHTPPVEGARPVRYIAGAWEYVNGEYVFSEALTVTLSQAERDALTGRLEALLRQPRPDAARLYDCTAALLLQLGSAGMDDALRLLWQRHGTRITALLPGVLADDVRELAGAADGADEPGPPASDEGPH